MKLELAAGPLLIRPFREEDAGALYEAVRESISEVSPWLPWCHQHYSIEESREFIGSRELASQGGEWYSFGIFEKDTGRFLGGVGINFINRVHQMANLGYWVRTSAAGRGIATMATRLAAKICVHPTGPPADRDCRRSRQRPQSARGRESRGEPRRRFAQSATD